MSQRPLRVLIVDDEFDCSEWLRVFLDRRGHDVRVASDANAADVLCRVWRPEVVLADLVMPGVDGLSLLHRLRHGDAPPHVIIVSGRASVPVAMDALAAGATSVLEKPVDAARLQGLLARVAEERYGRGLSDSAGEPEHLGRLFSRDPAMRHLFAAIRTAAPTTANVLIQGENGTGKELVAGALHDLSPRSGGPLIKVNCAAIPGELLESELFGHVRGSFTGAIADKKGLFELAHLGSILLDEIADMPLALQAKLLRVLQDREFRRVGSHTPVHADFRLICATNLDAARAVREGRLRQDLLFRLNTITLQIPPLRDRPGDISLLANLFLQRLAAAYDRRIDRFADSALRLLEQHLWPGNVRELEHVVERSVILARGEHIRVEDLPESVRRPEFRSPEAGVSLPACCSLEELERLAILHTLELTRWNKRATAKILGIHRPTLYNKLRKYGLWRLGDRFRRDVFQSTS